MGITALSRDWGIDPQIVRLVTTDTLQALTAAGYLASQAANIATFQNGVFQWRPDDYVLAKYAGGETFLNYDSVTNTLNMAGVGFSQVRLTSAQILGMYATPVLILPAPPAGKMIVLSRITGTYLFGTVQYVAGGAIGLEWGSAAHLAGPAASTTLAGATFDGYAASNTFELTPDNTDTLAHIIAMPVYISNDTAAFTTGDGSLLVNVNYTVVNAT